MKFSGIGGQAVMEGVMMRNKDKYAVAVRLPNKEIHIDIKEDKLDLGVWKKIPVVRGVVSFFASLIVGMKALMYSASFFEEEEEEKADLTEEEMAAKARKEKAEMGTTLVVSFVIALGLFMVFPYYLSKAFAYYISSYSVMAFVEGMIRVTLFLCYIAFISRMEDIKRVFMYHGAEHKCINCIEHGLELNVENVRKSDRQHKRCGTSFIFIVFLISVFVFMFIHVDSHVLQLLLRLLLVPVIAGVSYEFIQLAGRTENPVVNILSKPGMWVQNMTTREPDDDMIEVGIASVEAVFDWKKFQEEMKEDDNK
ncbi:MAG: DUF1385 domain-containing protein [Lachnospiraceae bacterium]|nr:DUF1385 domain-containing protein [Lachnospiraceae bacterium]